jgi:hypothetical protein
MSDVGNDDDDKDSDGVTVYVRVSYKAVLAVLVVFDIFHVSFQELVFCQIATSC